MSESERGPEEIEAEIEATRDDLGETVAEIADKADVKKQAGKKAEEVKEKATDKAKEVRDVATEKVESVKAAASKGTDPLGGSGGDIGSGPTGDVRNSPEILDERTNRTALIAAATALVVGLALGWAIWR